MTRTSRTRHNPFVACPERTTLEMADVAISSKIEAPYGESSSFDQADSVTRISWPH
jgi:hypothetical protein